MAPKNALKKNNGKESALSRFLNENIFIILAFICSAALMMIVYFCFDVIPFGEKTVLRMDLYHQYGPLFAELYDRITGFKSLLYSWTSAGGSSFLGNYMNYLSSPIALIILAFGHENIPESIGAMVLIKNALAAASMAYYLKKAHGKNDFSLPAFGIMYSFCGFFIAYYWNIMWIDAMYLLPLVALGIEKIINERKAKLYIAALAVTFFANYYMAFMVCVFSVLYFLVYFFGKYSIKDYDKAPRQIEVKEGKFVNKKFDCIKNSSFLNRGILFASSSCLAAALMAFVLIPTLFVLQACSATSGKMPEELSNYNTVFDFLANHLASVVPTIRSSGDTVIPNVYSGMLTLILVPLYLFCKKIPLKEKIANTLLLGVFFAAFNFNIPNFVIHAFHFPNDLPFRFSFIYSFFIVSIAYKALMHIKEFSGKELLTAGVALIGFIVIVEEIGQGNVTINTVAISIIFTAIYVTVLWLMKNPNFYQPTVALLLMCCVFAEASIANTNNFEITQVKPNFTNGYSEFRTLKGRLDSDEGNDYYRMELTDINTLMDNCWFNYNGTSVFSSMAYEKVSNAQKDLGLKGNYINSYIYHLQTPVYNAMMSLKYIVDNYGYTMNDSLYTSVASVGNFKAYKNNYYLPIGYCVNSAIKNWETDSSDNPFEIQASYWQKATGLSDVFTQVELTDVSLNNIDEDNSTFTGENFFYSKADPNEDASATANYYIQQAGNIYVYVNTNACENANITCGEFSENQNLDEPYILDLGYHTEDEILSVDLPFKDDQDSGTVGCYVYALNEDVFVNGYNSLVDGGLVIKDFTDTSISGSVSADEKCVFYTSISYDKGWSVMVDGKKVETFDLADETFLAFEIDAGEHEIEMKYTPRGLTAGISISFAAWFFVIVFSIVGAIKKKRKKNKEKANKAEDKPIMGIDALMAQDLGPNATAEDSEALLETEHEIIIEDIPEEKDIPIIQAEETTSDFSEIKEDSDETDK
ncbi:MAG: YfhO family protein [Clostridia bacterium]|nr:YfhO family protein [Clostridia bacterium]